MKSLIFGTALLAVSAGLASADVVRMGTEGAYPPYNFINDNGEVDGFERELGDELCARAELECEWVTNDWDSIIPNLVSGNYDTIIAGMSITEERDEVIDFTMAYFPPDPSAFVAVDADIDLTSAVIATQTGTIHASYVASTGATLIEFATQDEIVAAVLNGEADAALADKAFLEPVQAENADLVFVGEVALGGGVGLGVRESDTELKETFNTVIAEMKADGSLATLIEKWFPGVATDF